MKYTAIVVLLLLSSTSIVVDACYAQSLDMLTNLHPRPKVSYFHAAGAFTITPATPILISDTASITALDYLEQILQRALGYQLAPLRGNFTHGGAHAIYLGERGSYAALDSALNTSLAPGETMPSAQGYVLDVSDSGIVLAGTDADGTFNSISTFAQLLKGDSLPFVHINDWPDYPIRWVFSTHNLIVQSQITDLEAIEDSMAAHKLNGLQQNDFKNNIYSVFENSYPPYFYNVDTLQVHSYNANVELIPGLFPIGWSQGILFHDPDIAEGFPTTTSYLIQSDSGKLLTDPRMVLPNGGFENISNGQFTGWSFYDGPNVSAFVDSTTVHSGKYSARCTNFVAGNAGGNCRFERSVLCQPFHGYHMSVWINTQNFQGSEVQLLAIGHNGNQSSGLTFTQFSVPATSNGWNQYNVVFNTLTYDSLYVYCGVWGGTSGTIWFDDFQIEDAGMTNLLRRASDLPTVTGKSGSYAEGRDYAMLVDSVMEKNQGSYPWHSSPGFTVLPGSGIKNGDTVQVHFIRPNPTINDATGDGSTMVCVSEDTLYPILHDQMSLVDSQYHSNKYFMSHDEIREMNWDSACQSRKLTPAQLLADNVRKCDSIMHEVHPGAEVFDWSDMFDSLHNAHNNYYLVNGDLSGDWNLIPRDLTIVNWNGGIPDYSKPEINLRKQSMEFFSNLGFSQITSPYYDEHDTKNIRAWRDSMEGVPNMRGMMYTTWANDYSFLTPFADYAWSAGPMIVHEPPNLFETITDGEYVLINANVFADPYNPADSIVKVTYTQYDLLDGSDDTTIYTMFPDTGHFYRCANLTQGDPGTDVTYQIQATDIEGLTRVTPRYTIFHVPSEGVNVASPKIGFSIYPNPVSSNLNIRGMNDKPATILIEDLLGREVRRFESSSESSILDIQNIPAGIYECIITIAAGGREVKQFVKE